MRATDLAQNDTDVTSTVVQRLNTLMLTTLNELTAVGKRVGRARPDLMPSPELANTLQRLHLIANQVRR
jgi:hypothetical protein